VLTLHFYTFVYNWYICRKFCALILDNKYRRSRSRWPRCLRRRGIGRLVAGIVGSIPAQGMNACFAFLCCVVLCGQRLLRRGNHSFKGVLPSVLIKLRNFACVRRPRSCPGLQGHRLWRWWNMEDKAYLETLHLSYMLFCSLRILDNTGKKNLQYLETLMLSCYVVCSDFSMLSFVW
jgi:hypothetical protein